MGGCSNTSSPGLARVKFKYICLAVCSGCLCISASFDFLLLLFFLLLHFIDHGLFLSAVLPIRTLAYKRRTVTTSDKHIVMYSGSNKYLPRPGFPTVGNSIAWLNPPPRGGGADMGASAAPRDSWRVWTARAPSLGPALGLVDLPTGR